MRVVSVPSWEFADVVVQYAVWGSNRSRFGKWLNGEPIVVLVGAEGVVTGSVAGQAFVSDEMIWNADLFEYRVPLHVGRVIRGSAGKAAAVSVRKAMLAGIGSHYGSYIMSQSKLPEAAEKLVAATL